jgi:hypothetical protein
MDYGRYGKQEVLKEDSWEHGPVGVAEKEVVPKIEKIMKERGILSPILAFRTYFEELKEVKGENHFKRFSNFCEKVFGVGPSISAHIRKMYAFIFPDKIVDGKSRFTNKAISNRHLFNLIHEEMRKNGIDERTLAERVSVLEALIANEITSQRIKDIKETDIKRKANPTVQFREARHFELFQRALAKLLDLRVEEVKEEFLKDGALLHCFYYPEEFKKENERQRHQFGR